jgi:hypothetical protein
MTALDAAPTGQRSSRGLSLTSVVVLALALLTAAWSIAVIASGGIDLRRLGMRIVARTPWPTLGAAVTLLFASVVWRRGATLDDATRVVDAIRRAATTLAIALALVTALIAIRFGTFTVGGSDSNCYVAQAERWAAGTMMAPVKPGFETTWPNAALSLTPTGFVPSRSVEGAIAPICPAGLALAMATPRVLGAPRESVFYVVPLLAGLAVLCTFLVGRRFGGPLAGLASAAIGATSPVFLYQAVQPMSDVPAAACWMLALALAARGTSAARFVTGLAAGAAVLMRPNLAPLVLVFVGFAAVREGRCWRDPRGMARRGALVLLGLTPAVAVVGLVQDLLYGSPFSSGYGGLDALFRLAHVPLNLERFSRWLVETQSPFVLLGLLAPFVIWRRQRRARTNGDTVAYAMLCWLVAVGAFAAYLAYVPFDGWWFLRFWLPGILPLVVLAVNVVVEIALVRASGSPRIRESANPGPLAITLLFACCVALGAWQLGVARDRSVFDLRRFEWKFVAAGQYVATLPASAVVLAIWHSGAVDYYGDRPTVVWDAIAPGDLDAVVGSLRAQGREVFLLLEPREEADFRARFGGASALASLDWPPRARFGSEVTLWALSDRDRFLRGEATQSDRVWME